MAPAAPAGRTGDAGHAAPRTVLVTGASSGIGAATARLLAARGTTVCLVARRAERLAAVLSDCRTCSPASRSWVADLADPTGAADLAAEIWDAAGPLDVVVHNAGIPLRRPVMRLTMEDVERALRVNYLSPVAMTLALLPRMLERGAGTVVNVSSLGGRLGVTTESAYCASKFALAGWSEAIAADLVGTGVRVRLVLPGAIDTEIWDRPGNDPPVYDGPLAPPEEVATAIVACIDSDRFEHYVPDLKGVVEFKTADVDAYLEGMRAMAEGRLGPEAVPAAGTRPEDLGTPRAGQDLRR